MPTPPPSQGGLAMVQASPAPHRAWLLQRVHYSSGLLKHRVWQQRQWVVLPTGKETGMDQMVEAKGGKCFGAYRAFSLTGCPQQFVRTCLPLSANKPESRLREVGSLTEVTSLRIGPRSTRSKDPIQNTAFITWLLSQGLPLVLCSVTQDNFETFGKQTRVMIGLTAVCKEVKEKEQATWEVGRGKEYLFISKHCKDKTSRPVSMGLYGKKLIPQGLQSTEFLLLQKIFERTDQKMINHIINKLFVCY